MPNVFIIISIVWGGIFWFWWYRSLRKSLHTPYHRQILTWRTVLFFCAFLCFLWASWVTTPQWLFNDNDHEIIVALDVSQSMLVEDMWPKKSRLAYAKEKINDVVVNIPNAKRWLTIFAWETQNILPVSSDISLFLTILAWVDHRNLTKQWTQLGEAIRESSQRFDSDSTAKKTVLVLSDGWDDPVLPDEQLHSLIQSGAIQLFILWIWTPTWWPIPMWVDLFWNLLTKQRKNQTVISSLQEQSMKTAANTLWGEYSQWNERFFATLHRSIVSWKGWVIPWWWVRRLLLRLWTICFLCGVCTQRYTTIKRKKWFFDFLSVNEKK